MKQIIADIAKNTRETVRVELDEFQGRQLVGARVRYMDKAGELRPRPKGLTVDVKHLPALREAFAQAERVAREAGPIS